ncbi:MAG: hypothetical protein E7363_05135 [Clostridiales bacterium]|nr:hypothetical protein [Clostridiales bacterium]
MAKIVGVKFKNAGKVYYFDPRGEVFRGGEGVIVETAKGLEYGVTAGEVREVADDEVVQPLKPVVRRATQKDEDSRKHYMEKRSETMKVLKELIEKSGLEMKLVDAEYSFDGSKLFVYFSAENRVDFRELVHTINVTLKTRVDLRQIGIRDEAKMLGGFAPCGRPCCCSAFLQDFKKVSIKMAKTQGLSLNPGKISGLCGRLMCCLDYENDYYAEVSKQMPKIGAQVETEDGVGTVVSNNMLKLITRVKFVNADNSEVYRDYESATMKAFKKESAEVPVKEVVEVQSVEGEEVAETENIAQQSAFPQAEKTEKVEKTHHRDRGNHGGKRHEKRGEHKPHAEKADKPQGERKAHGENKPQSPKPQGVEGEQQAQQTNHHHRRHRHHHRGNHGENNGGNRGEKNNAPQGEKK